MPTNAELNAEVERLQSRLADLEQAQQNVGHPGAVQGNPADLTGLLQSMQQQQDLMRQTLESVIGNQQPRNEGRVPARKMEAPELKSPTDITLAGYREWERRWNGYAKGTRLYTDCDHETQLEVLRGCMHEDWGKLWSGKALDIADTDKPPEIIQKMGIYLRKCRNPLLDRVQFHERDQQKGESMNMYVAALRLILESCAFEDPGNCVNCKQFLDGLLRDRFVCGLANKETQRKLFEVPFEELTLEKAITLALAHESSMSTQASLQNDEINAMRKPSTYKKGKGLPKTPNSGKEDKQDKKEGPKPKPAGTGKQKKKTCGYCGGAPHLRRDCPARDKECHDCQRKGHFASCCWGKDRSGPPTGAQGGDLGGLFMGKVALRQSDLETIATKTNVDGSEVEIDWVPDTGATCTAIPEKLLSRFPAVVATKAKKESAYVTTADEGRVKTVGKVQATIEWEGRSYSTAVHILPKMKKPLLSKTGCVALGLLPEGWPNMLGKLSTSDPRNPEVEMDFPLDHPEVLIAQFKKEFPVVFDDSGILAPMGGPLMHIDLVPGAVPVRRLKPRPIPIHWQARVKSQLDEMVAKGVAEKMPVGHCPEWVHPMMAVPKKSSEEPRMVVDLTALNKYVKRPVHPGGVPKELISEIPPNQKWFTTLDARHGYWQVELDEDSRDLTAFMTPWGMYRYKRNVMGLASAGDEFTRRVDEALEGIQNMKRVVEDILIYDEEYDTHIYHVREVMERCKRYGITLHAKKCVIGAKMVKWCGYRISPDGYTIDGDLCRAIADFPRPQSRTDVRSFCGLINQFEQFSVEIAKLAEPLRPLMSSSTKFLWEGYHEKAFRDVIEVLKGPRVLAHFRPRAPMRLETDASRTGLGYALWQKGTDDIWRLLRCGSRFISDTESRYSVTELEMLAVVWAARKCEQFIKGTEAELIVDHKPLIPILNYKTLDQIGSSRAVLLKEKLESFLLKAVWRKGSQHTVADVFSRSAKAENDLEVACGLKMAALASEDVEGNRMLVDPVLDSVRKAGEADPVYQQLISSLKSGFPQQKKQLPATIHAYWSIKDDLMIQDGIVTLGDRIVVPASLRSQVLKDLHASHQGQERTTRRARQCVYWPGISRDIQSLVRKCQKCAELLPGNQPEPLVPDVVPQRPGEAIATDLFALAGKEFLVVTDKYSGWPEVWALGKGVSCGAVIQCLRIWVSHHGAPVRMTTDGGPQFKSAELQNWCKAWGIDHELSSPYHHIANGHAEAAVKAMKHLAIKCDWKGCGVPEAFTAGLLEWRNTPRNDGLSPAERLYGYRLRTKVPAMAPQHPQDSGSADRKATEIRKKAEERYNGKAKPLPVFKVGEKVLIQNMVSKRWDTQGTVIRLEKRGRSYLVRAENGTVYWRNRKFLRLDYSAGANERDKEEPQPLRRSPRAPKQVDRFGQ